MRDLIDSLYTGYPTGYLIISQSPNIKLKDGTLAEGKRIMIDGQQRVTALMTAIMGMDIINADFEKKRIKIAFNPLANPDNDEERFKVQDNAILKDKRWIADIAEVFKPTFDMWQFVNDYCEANKEITGSILNKIVMQLIDIKNRQIGVITLDKELTIDEVTEIFIRINSQGAKLNQADFAMSKIAANVSYGGNMLRKAIDYLTDYCKDRECPLVFYNVTPEMYAQLETWYPGRFTIEYDRDSADYVYETEKLATLAGKKLHGKRNHINKFKTLYPDWTYEKLSDDNVEECFQMALKWRNQNGCEDDPEKNAEMCVTLNSLRLYKELDLTGGVLKTGGRIVAFTVGESLCDDTFVVHIEKAFPDVEGAYPMINQQFVQHECTDYKYVNREEDTGAEGLRKAKLSYKPAFLEEKGIVKETE